MKNNIKYVIMGVVVAVIIIVIILLVTIANKKISNNDENNLDNNEKVNITEKGIEEFLSVMVGNDEKSYNNIEELASYGHSNDGDFIRIIRMLISENKYEKENNTYVFNENSVQEYALKYFNLNNFVYNDGDDDRFTYKDSKYTSTLSFGLYEEGEVIHSKPKVNSLEVIGNIVIANCSIETKRYTTTETNNYKININVENNDYIIIAINKLDNLTNDDSSIKETNYKVFSDNFIKNRQEYYDTTVKNKNYFVVESGVPHISDSDIILDNNGNLYYQKDNQKEKIATNVLNYKFLYTGNGGQRLLYFLKEDGTVSIAKGVSLATPESSNITFNKDNLDIIDNIGGYKNIVSFIEGSVLYMGGAASPMFIDIYGNMYNESLNNEYDNSKNISSYQIFKDNFIKNRVEYYDNTKDREYFERGPSGYIKLDNNGNLYYQKDNQKISIATNVLNYEFLYDGNGGQKTLYFLKEDGTVSFADGIKLVPSNNNELIINDNIDIHNNVGGYKNIVSFIEANSSYCGNQICDDIASPIFIDIEGNMHNINLN